MAPGKKTKNPFLVIASSAQHSILETENLKIGYSLKKEEKVIASGINVRLEQGGLTAVLGSNGVGKSTFLRTLSGVQPGLAGKIILENNELQSITPQKQAALVSVVLTQQPFSRNLSVWELIALGRQPYTNWIGNLSDEDRAQVQEALRVVQIEELQNRKCFELSDGQLQKVMIARALAQDTPVMILDEPTTHLDMYHKAQVLKLLKELSQKKRKAILFATHEINLALQLCDSIILMQPKQVRQGKPEELIKQRAFEDVFPQDLIFFDSVTGTFKIKT